MIRVERDVLSSDAVIALLAEHLSEMHEVTPNPASVHALDVDALRAPEVEFWAAWEDGQLLASARAAGYRRLLLETGSSDFYLPAQRLYQRNGFAARGPFAGYREDPNSVFMELGLG
jgi:putative acetyltransferase